MIEYADVIVDLQAGDTGKGKVAHAKCKSKEYTHVVRYNGGGNAGHTVYHNGEKYVTHFIPIGVVYGIKSIIGLGCVVDPIKLEEEIKDLEKGGFKVRENLFIDEKAHVILPEYVEEDSKDTKIGTTRTGNGQAYRNKYNRTGVRAKDVFSEDMLIDTYEEFHGESKVRILFEGAQGFEIDIDFGDYPYVTSSHCTVGGAVLNGVAPKYIRNTIGIIKAYRTYVGAKDFEGKSDYFEKIREVGGEFGATTGRPRQINWLNLDDVIKASNINGVNELIINKLDVLEEVGIFVCVYKGVEVVFSGSEEFVSYCEQILSAVETIESVVWSRSPYKI